MGKSEVGRIHNFEDPCAPALIVFAVSVRATAFCFCSHSKTPAQIIYKYFQYAY